MAKVIEFYVPTNFRTPLKGTSRRCGKVIEFCTQTTKSALLTQSGCDLTATEQLSDWLDKKPATQPPQAPLALRRLLRLSDPRPPRFLRTTTEPRSNRTSFFCRPA